MAVPKILAPAGGREQLLAAVRCGAEAVYLGAKGFNARRNASNFAEAELADAARYCRERGVKLYVTVNTMVFDRELPALEAAADLIAEAGADGVILQDMAAARLFSRRYPHILRVASTQTAVHNRDGARFLEDAGFDSFVLARELTLSEMEKIIAAVGIPAEAFVHGAHCMSVSGMCTLSAMLGGRSGNRGLCAQPCRLAWRCGASDHALSLKDMSLIRHIPALAEIGVQTLKIEGRMKRPEYVAAAVTACRAARDGEAYDEDTLRAVFSRSGFTDGYLAGKTDGGMFGYRTKEDVTGAEGVLRGLRELYRREYQSVPVSMALTVTEDAARLDVSDGEHSVSAAGEAPQPAVNRPLDAASAERSLSKTGGTQYYVNLFKAEIAPGLMLPAAQLNDMRRRALDKLNEIRGAAPPFTRVEENSREQTGQKPRHFEKRSGTPPLWARFYRAEQIACEDTLARVILPISEITPALADRLGDRLTAALPAVCFPADEERLYAAVEAAKAMGVRELWTENIYGIELARRLGLGVRGGFGLNIANAEAARFCAEAGLLSLTVSFELPMTAVGALAGDIDIGLAAYGYLPLMRYRNCPLRAQIGCTSCAGAGNLTDRRGVVFPVECGERRYSTLLNSVPLDIAGREVFGDFRLLWFTREGRGEAAETIGRFMRGEAAEGPHTGGLYYRKVL